MLLPMSKVLTHSTPTHVTMQYLHYFLTLLFDRRTVSSAIKRQLRSCEIWRYRTSRHKNNRDYGRNWARCLHAGHWNHVMAKTLTRKFASYSVHLFIKRVISSSGWRNTRYIRTVYSHGTGDSALCLPCILFQSSVECINKPKALVGSDGYHVVMMTNTRTSKMSRLMWNKGKYNEQERELAWGR